MSGLHSSCCVLTGSSLDSADTAAPGGIISNKLGLFTPETWNIGLSQPALGSSVYILAKAAGGKGRKDNFFFMMVRKNMDFLGKIP